MPARLKRKKTQKPTKNKYLKYLFWLPIVIVGIYFLRILLSGSDWDGNDKLNLLIRDEGGDVAVTVFDPVKESITKVVIPGVTQVNASKNLGNWKVKSIWELGENEGLKGPILTHSIVRSFKIPVYYWADSKALLFTKGN